VFGITEPREVNIGGNAVKLTAIMKMLGSWIDQGLKMVQKLWVNVDH